MGHFAVVFVAFAAFAVITAFIELCDRLAPSEPEDAPAPRPGRGEA